MNVGTTIKHPFVSLNKLQEIWINKLEAYTNNRERERERDGPMHQHHSGGQWEFSHRKSSDIWYGNLKKKLKLGQKKNGKRSHSKFR